MKISFFCNIFLLSLLPLTALADADHFERGAVYTVCFTPQQDCTQKIVAAINNAVSSINVQAYSFTSRPIEQALTLAEQRGVKVKVIFDKSILERPHNLANYFTARGIKVWIDNQPAIAHNKVMIIDQTRVITGSFNFTRAAQQQNAENLLLIDDGHLAQKYLQNWQRRQQLSEAFKVRNETKEQPYDWLARFFNWLKRLWQSL